jgi:hypothetical protein
MCHGDAAQAADLSYNAPTVAQARDPPVDAHNLLFLTRHRKAMRATQRTDALAYQRAALTAGPSPPAGRTALKLSQVRGTLTSPAPSRLARLEFEPSDHAADDDNAQPLVRRGRRQRRPKCGSAPGIRPAASSRRRDCRRPTRADSRSLRLLRAREQAPNVPPPPRFGEHATGDRNRRGLGSSTRGFGEAHVELSYTDGGGQGGALL